MVATARIGVRSVPGGLFELPEGAQGFFEGPEEAVLAPENERNRARDPLWAPARMLGSLWVDFGSIWDRFGVTLGVDFGSISDLFGMHFGTILDPSEEFSMPLFPPLSLIGATMERSIDR